MPDVFGYLKTIGREISMSNSDYYLDYYQEGDLYRLDTSFSIFRFCRSDSDVIPLETILKNRNLIHERHFIWWDGEWETEPGSSGLILQNLSGPHTTIGLHFHIILCDQRHLLVRSDAFLGKIGPQ